MTEFILFFYLLVATRVLCLQGKLIYQLSKIIARGIHLLFIRSLLAIFLWPIDYFFIPTTFFKAYVLSDRKAIFDLGFYYGKTVFNIIP